MNLTFVKIRKLTLLSLITLSTGAFAQTTITNSNPNSSGYEAAVQSTSPKNLKQRTQERFTNPPFQNDADTMKKLFSGTETDLKNACVPQQVLVSSGMLKSTVKNQEARLFVTSPYNEFKDQLIKFARSNKVKFTKDQAVQIDEFAKYLNTSFSSTTKINSNLLADFKQKTGWNIRVDYLCLNLVSDEVNN